MHTNKITWVAWMWLISFMDVQAASVPIKLSVGNNAPSGLALSWDSQTGKTYRVLQATNVTSFWWPQGVRLTATGSVSSVVVPKSDPVSGFFRIQEMTNAGGALMLTNGQTISGTIEIDMSVYSLSNNVQGIYLLDVTGGVTNVVASYGGNEVTNSAFTLDTTMLYPSLYWGPRTLMLKVIDDYGYPWSDDVHIVYSDPITVTVDNEFWVPEAAYHCGWMMSVVFDTTVLQGYWAFEAYDDHDQLYLRSDLYDLADPDMVDPNGNIAWHEWATNGQYRDYWSEYDTDYFTIIVYVFPSDSGAPSAVPKPPKTKTYRKRVQRRSRIPQVIVAEQAGVIGRRDGDILADTAFETILESMFSFTGHQIDVNYLISTTTPADTEGWSVLRGRNDWLNMNKAIGGTNAVGQASQVFTFSHSGGEHIGYTNIESQLSRDTLEANGFYYWIYGVPGGRTVGTHAATYWMAAGCNVMEGTLMGTLVGTGNHHYNQPWVLSRLWLWVD